MPRSDGGQLSRGEPAVACRNPTGQTERLIGLGEPPGQEFDQDSILKHAAAEYDRHRRVTAAHVGNRVGQSAVKSHRHEAGRMSCGPIAQQVPDEGTPIELFRVRVAQGDFVTSGGRRIAGRFQQHRRLAFDVALLDAQDQCCGAVEQTAGARGHGR